ncbi:MAG: hypothetical protein HYS53_01180 [Candidatus Aenigmarchaeota archaeon]|nr:hypothetical protein [Candidatus Aenigmarchaeota archaeon]
MIQMKICGHCGLEYVDSRSQCLRCGNTLRTADSRGPIAMGSSGATEKHANFRQW